MEGGTACRLRRQHVAHAGRHEYIAIDNVVCPQHLDLVGEALLHRPLLFLYHPRALFRLRLANDEELDASRCNSLNGIFEFLACLEKVALFREAIGLDVELVVVRGGIEEAGGIEVQMH
jgi:hypothetical protein